MASSLNAALCALVATALWGLVGFTIARHLLPRVLALGAAPIIGWAVYNAIALPLFMLVGFSATTVIGLAVVAVLLATGSLLAGGPMRDPKSEIAIPAWAYVAAAALALAPASAVAPKFVGDTVQLATPIFDHSKAAMIDAMTRLGLPPVNPFFGEHGEPGRLAYYYLYHFSAAELSLALGVSGWEADIAMTWFVAFASLTVMMGVAVWLGGRGWAAGGVVLLAAAGSLRTMLEWIFGEDAAQQFFAEPTGFSGWLFQTAWVPQHIASASCVIVAMLLLARCAERATTAPVVTLALVVAAGFESSAFVGGITFVVGALIAVPLLFARVDKERRTRFALAVAAAAVLAAAVATPFVLDQIASIRMRDGGASIVLDHFMVLGDMFPPRLGRALDLPAYWLVLLPVEFPAAYIPGALALYIMLRRSDAGAAIRPALSALAALTAASLAVSWLLVSTIGDVNDLGLRAVLPGLFVLIAAAAGLAARLDRRAIAVAVVAISGLALSLPETVAMIRSYAVGEEAVAARSFARSPELWAAVRRHTGPAQRVANNPLSLRDMTPWPVNIGWALLSQRNSCFSGRETALAYVPLPREQREALNMQFIRVFDGRGTPDDVTDMATRYGCAIVVVTAEDKAWDADPFATSPHYRLVESREGRWRIYEVVSGLR